jgi:Ca-activated chloride channel homolog
MRHARALPLALVLALAAGSALVTVAAQDPQAPIFRAGVRTVPVYATVFDNDGRLVPGLAEEDFQILDNGRPAPITLFSDESLPFTVVVMLDTSASMTEHLTLLNRAAEQFLIRMLPVDRAQVGAFNSKLQLSGTFTNDRDELIAELDELQVGNSTRLWDAVEFSLDALHGVEGRRVVLMFTDGDDYGSSVRFRTVMERARDEEVMVYAIGLEVRYFNGQRWVHTRPDRNLRRIADETGGGYFELKKSDELASTFTRVSQELRSQYLLGFAPENLDGRVHKLEVQVKKPGMTVRARRSYLAVDE